MANTKEGRDHRPIDTLYAGVTDRIIAELEQGRLPWVQPWNGEIAMTGLPRNASSGRAYGGINILILWHALFERGFAHQRWLTFKQAQALGGTVRKGERGTTVCYADTFTPRSEQDRARDEDREARQLAFLKRFTVFNVDQCEGLPEALTTSSAVSEQQEMLPQVQALITASGAQVRVGGVEAYYAPQSDYIAVPPQAAFNEPINWYRTLLHELGHWTGHGSRLGRDQTGRFGSAPYAREELVAELCSAFTCAALGIVPTVRHADYIGLWLEVLRADNRAIFRAASHASKAADYLLRFREHCDGEAGA